MQISKYLEWFPLSSHPDGVPALYYIEYIDYNDYDNATNYHLEGKECKPNVCTCQNGQPKTGGECLIHDKEDCIPSGCNKGFHFALGLCKSNVGCEKIIDDMLETAVFDDTVFDVKKEGVGIRIKKLNTQYRVVSFPKSQKITSFTVINKGGSEWLSSYFINTPYTKKTSAPSKRAHSIGAYSAYGNSFRTRGAYTTGKIERSGIPEWNNKNDSFSLTKISKFIDLGFTTSNGDSKFTVNPEDYGTYDVQNMTPVIEMHYKDTEIFITNIRDANNPFC